MFNNPLVSFHDTVAQAKKEREQFDRLLTISTPRERILVAIVALLLVFGVAWLFLGTVTRSIALDGFVVASEGSSGARDGSVRAIAWLDRDAASGIRVGMPAVVRFGASNGETGTHEGEVAAVSAVRPAGWRGTGRPQVPVSMYRIEVSLSGGPDPDGVAGRTCRVFIETGSRSPIALLLTRRS